MRKEGEIKTKKIRANMHWHYFQISRDNVELYETTQKEIEGYLKIKEKKRKTHMNLGSAYIQRERYVVIPIVFSAMCIEAFLYDYGASHLSGKFVRSHLDKLDIVSKLVVLTELITRTRFPKDSQAYEKLVKLVKDRNDLVHFKSKSFNPGDIQKLDQWHVDMNNKLKEAMYNALEVVPLVLKEIDKLHDNSTGYAAQITDSANYA